MFGISISSDFLPVQLVYQGQSTECLSHFAFPPERGINFNEDNWSNECTMLCFFKKVMSPYISKKRAELNFPSDYLGLLIFHNFKQQSIIIIYSNYLILAKQYCHCPSQCNCTDRLQLLDMNID